jgi:hypothetical protein
MFTLLKYLFRTANPLTTGAQLDTRTDAEKKDDLHFSEVVGMATAVKWEERQPRQFPVLDQKQAFMCGAFALRKSMGIMYSLYPKYGSYVDLSSAHIYQRRMDRPIAGMSMSDMFNIASQGTALYALTNEKITTDADADSLSIPSWIVEIGKSFSIGGGVYLPVDFETVASTIQATGKGVILFQFFTAGEWARQFPTIVENLNVLSNNALRHFVTAVDFVLKDGKKYIVVEDSAHFGGLAQRYLSEEWFKARTHQAGYPMNFKFQTSVGDRPTYDNYFSTEVSTVWWRLSTQCSFCRERRCSYSCFAGKVSDTIRTTSHPSLRYSH